MHRHHSVSDPPPVSCCENRRVMNIAHSPFSYRRCGLSVPPHPAVPGPCRHPDTPPDASPHYSSCHCQTGSNKCDIFIKFIVFALWSYLII